MLADAGKRVSSSAVEVLHQNGLKGHLDYQESTHLEQFVTRFLLKETTNQLHSLQSSLECAMETTAEQTRQEKHEGCVRTERMYPVPDQNTCSGRISPN
ncbi:hypothetical protein ILYODFUR_035220 [Ilyodon furcidens]|uniref:Uncharacterized protein n=1 Tax=Ilyodon furcidens TaxID=33524 RepID=A0ABV0UXU1_9TELE